MRDVRMMVNVLEGVISKNYSKLTKSQKKVAEYIIKNPEEVTFLSSKELGEKVKVSDATVIRLSNALGFSGFSELQEMLQSWLKGKLTPSEKLKVTKINRGTDIYASIFNNNIKNIMKTQEEIPTSKFEEAVNILDEAKRIFVVGLRRSHSFAFHLYYNLSRILNNIVLIDSAHGLKYDQIEDIGKGDVLLSMSFPRYAKETSEITKIAKERKAFVIAITDNPLSPISRIADISLHAGYESPFFFGSHASTLIIADCIIGGLSLKHRKKYINILKRFESKLKKSGVWIE